MSLSQLNEFAAVEKTIRNGTPGKPARSEQNRKTDAVEDPRHLAHDARNWLTVLQVYCDLLRSPGVVARGYEPWVTELSGAVERGHHLIASMLKSLPQQEPLPPPIEAETNAGLPKPRTHRRNAASHPRAAVPETVDIAAALTRWLPLWEQMAGEAIRVGLDTPADPGRIAMAEETLERIAQNLVRNAIEAMPQGGRLRITVRAGAHSVLLRVTDTGGGVAPEMLHRIFEPGVSGKAGKGRCGNRGFGLAIVRDLAEKAGGSVRLRSRRGHGSCFEVRLPRP